MNETKLEIDRNIIPNALRRLVLYGDLDVCQFWTMLLLFPRKAGLGKNRLLMIVSDRTPSSKILKLTIGSFHGFGNKAI